MDDRTKNFLDQVCKQFGADTEGIWQIFGADDNCDLGGTHYIPSLGFYKGRLIDVAKLAVTLDRFWSWGAGEIKRVTIMDVSETTKDELQKLRSRKTEIEQELDELNEKLRHFGDN